MASANLTPRHELTLYTIQIARWRLLTSMGLKLFDTTVKSGEPRVAPTWQIVLGHKDGSISDDQYTAEYLKILNESYLTNPAWWDALLKRNDLVLACYCRPDKFCHRHLLKEFIKRKAIVKGVLVHDKGELQ